MVTVPIKESVPLSSGVPSVTLGEYMAVQSDARPFVRNQAGDFHLYLTFVPLTLPPSSFVDRVTFLLDWAITVLTIFDLDLQERGQRYGMGHPLLLLFRLVRETSLCGNSPTPLAAYNGWVGAFVYDKDNRQAVRYSFYEEGRVVFFIKLEGSVESTQVVRIPTNEGHTLTCNTVRVRVVYKTLT